jgi:hypothetical protein
MLTQLNSSILSGMSGWEEGQIAGLAAISGQLSGDHAVFWPTFH